MDYVRFGSTGLMDDAVAALSVHLTPDEIHHLEEAYQPHPVIGFA